MNTPYEAVPTTRGCGRRVAGGAYWELGLGPWGTPPHEFLIDPPLPIPLGLAVRPLGVQLLTDEQGVTHVVDWVGSQHYPNLADYWEETTRYGASRRLPRTLDFSRLSPASRLLLIHSRARMTTWQDPAWQVGTCPTGVPPHERGADQEATEGPCLGLCWHDVEGGTPAPTPDDPDRVLRAMPSFAYTAWARPAGAATAYEPGIFASLPATRLVVVAGNNHEMTLERARRSSLPVDDVEE